MTDEVTRKTREAIKRAGYRVAGVQATLQLPGETICDDARVAADLDLEDVRQALQMALSALSYRQRKKTPHEAGLIERVEGLASA